MSQARQILHQIWEHESTARKRLAESIAKKLGVGEDQVSKWANKTKEVPQPKREALMDCLRDHMWKVDASWRFAGALTESLGADITDFSAIDRYVQDNRQTGYRVARLNSDGRLTVGTATVEPLGDRPYWWTYKYNGESAGGKVIERTYQGPVVQSGKCILALLMGGKSGEEPYARAELFWPKHDTQTEMTFGLSLSTFLEKGTPMASPFALISLDMWNSDLEENADAKLKLESDLKERSVNGILVAVK